VNTAELVLVIYSNADVTLRGHDELRCNAVFLILQCVYTVSKQQRELAGCFVTVKVQDQL
jgi:hypothetical protein